MEGRLAAWAREELSALDGAGLRRHLETLESPQGAVVTIAGERLINFSSNDYLGLASNEGLSRSAHAALESRGAGSGSSRLIAGDLDAHRSLEKCLAEAFGTESALVFGSGYAANVGVMSTIAGEGDVLFSDALNHASIIDGCRLSRARVEVYGHGDASSLDRALESVKGRRRIVVTESLFSMDGDHAPLEELARICERHNAALVVDEAHAFGVIGPRGLGLVESLGLSERVDLRIGTFGKAAGAYGAFVVGSQSAVDWLVNRARSFVFSTALPPVVCAAAEAGVRIALSDDDRRARLWRNIEQLAAGLKRMNLPAAAQGPIFPVVLGFPERALEASRTLRGDGLLVKAIRPPTVPPGTSRLRISLSASHEQDHIERLLEALARIRRAP